MNNGFLSRLLSFVCPARCPVCGMRAEVRGRVVCDACDFMLPRTGYAANPYDNDMAKMYWGRIPVEKVAALLFYHAGAASCNVVYEMKYHDNSDICQAMGRKLASEIAGTGFFDGIDMLMPIPLARSRERARGYNQSYEMAKGISEVTSIPVVSGVVKRMVFRQSQTSLDRLQRLENTEGIWNLVDGSKVQGKHVLLVDDVVTTGATTIGCAKELLKTPCVKLSILSLAYAKH